MGWLWCTVLPSAWSGLAKGGLVKKGHNDLCDCNVKLADVAWGGVSVEPIHVPENDRQGRPMLQADGMVMGVWEGS